MNSEPWARAIAFPRNITPYVQPFLSHYFPSFRIPTAYLNNEGRTFNFAHGSGSAWHPDLLGGTPDAKRWNSRLTTRFRYLRTKNGSRTVSLFGRQMSAVDEASLWTSAVALDGRQTPAI